MRTDRDLFMWTPLSLWLALAAISYPGAPVQANDWGYENSSETTERSPAPVELHAPPALIVSPRDPAGPKGSKTTPGRTGTTKSGASPAKTAPNATTPNTVSPLSATNAPPSGDRVDQDKQSSVCWLQLFQIAAKAPLGYEQQKRFEDYMLAKAKLGGKYTTEVRAVLKFWPTLMAGLRNKPELEAGYVSLFHALLRIREAMPLEKVNVEGELTSDSDLITELLGVQRIAVTGTPALTEEAINAYADLTCFIYEQKHPGKTVDADDNRALLARVVADKFQNAPTDNDRKAMARFDLAWAKFRILWDNADAPTRKIMLDKLTKDGAGSTLSLTKDPLLEQVLAAWPWSTKP